MRGKKDKAQPSLESLKRASLEIPRGDDSKGKVKHFVFHLFIFLITATVREKWEQLVWQRHRRSMGTLAYMEISFIASCYQWTRSNDEVIKAQAAFMESTHWGTRQTEEISLVSLNHLQKASTEPRGKLNSHITHRASTMLLKSWTPPNLFS